ncbi:MAG: NAD(P)H-hydrate dehydratase [Candidatus Eisenbacteria bacterium]|nr:NAD(P)H-hydrate dehydratase [Candidatus Eisenbacteria bacterium]
MKLVTSETMRAIDRECIENRGIPGLELMENAGVGTARFMETQVGPVSEKVFSVVCGKGNNGGDGFVIARELRDRGAAVTVYLVGSRGDVSGDARSNLERFGPDEIVELSDGHGMSGLALELSGSDVIVDALFGTGFQGEPRGLSGTVIGQIRRAGRPVLAVDVPSGLNATTGAAEGECVLAHWTCTMGLPKRGFFLHPGRTLVGRIHVVDIGIPDDVIDAVGAWDNVLTTREVAATLPARDPDGHKGTFGRVLVVAGSAGLTGAAALSSMSALRSGAGLVYLGAPSSLNDVLETKLTEVVTVPLPETGARSISAEAVPVIGERLESVDALALGPGLSRDPSTVRMVGEIVGGLDLPCVIDADGLNALSLEQIAARKGDAPLVLTPHLGELARLMDCATADVQDGREEMVRDVAARARAVVLLKGAATVSSDPSGELFLNPTGNSGLATGGTGDVLTGVIAALLARGVPGIRAAAMGAFIHGLAGDIAAERVGATGMVAGDVLERLPESFRLIEGGGLVRI